MAAIGQTTAAPAPGSRPFAPLTPDSPQSDARRVQTFVDQAGRLQREGHPDLALKTLDDGLKVAPRDPRLRFMYGVILNQMHRDDEAADVFQQITQDYPELPEPYNNLAVLYAQRGDLDQARAALERAIRALPGYALANENLGDVYLRLAARSYEKAGKLDTRGDGTHKLRLARALIDKIAQIQPAPRRAPAPPPTEDSTAPGPATAPRGPADETPSYLQN